MNANLSTLLWRTAATMADQPAILERGQVTTYGQLARRAGAVAQALAAAGAQPGDRVALLHERSADAIAALFGIHAAGLVAVVLSERLKARQLEHQLDASGCRILLTSDSTLARLPRLPESKAARIDLPAIAAAADFTPVHRDPGDYGQIIYTSGSTGLPKGVAFTHGALQSGVAMVNGYLGQRSSDRIASLLALSTVYGLNQVMTGVSCGASIIVETAPLANDMVASLREQGATVLAAVPPLWQQLFGADRFDGASMPALRILQNAGGHLPVETVRRVRAAFPAAQLFLQYGQTETFRGTWLPPDQTDRRPDSMGRAVPGAELRVMAENGTEAAPGEPGELIHTGPTIAAGYWGDPDNTAKVFRPYPFDAARAARGEKSVFSGDIVKKDAEGFFYYVSRSDRLIKTMGFRVGPDEVGDVVQASGEVREVVILGEPDPERGARIIAYVVLREGGDPQKVVRYCRAELPMYMVPAKVVPVAELPRLPSGKYDVVALKAAVAAGQA